MRATTAYFVGAGTIIAALAIGLGGGIVAGNIMNPSPPRQGPDTSKMTARTDAAPATADGPSGRVRYLTGTQAFGAMIAAPAQAKEEVKAEIKPDAQAVQANAEPPASQPSQAAAEPSKPTPASSSRAAKSSGEQASTEAATSPPEDAHAKASDADVKRAAIEQRRAERHERWAARHRRDSRRMRDRTDWDDVARNIREDSDARAEAERPRGGFPQVRLFEFDDD